MRILFDTSVLVAGIVEAHPMHGRSGPWLEEARAGEFEFLAASHALAELYAVLTRLPLSPRISPGMARRLIQANVEAAATIVPLDAADYARVLTHVAQLEITGGAVYDALIARTAEIARADRLLTLNPGDFQRVWPEGKAILSVP